MFLLIWDPDVSMELHDMMAVKTCSDKQTDHEIGISGENYL
jgi:hypothetical protein